MGAGWRDVPFYLESLFLPHSIASPFSTAVEAAAPRHSFISTRPIEGISRSFLQIAFYSHSFGNSSFSLEIVRSYSRFALRQRSHSIRITSPRFSAAIIVHLSSQPKSSLFLQWALSAIPSSGSASRSLYALTNKRRTAQQSRRHRRHFLGSRNTGSRKFLRRRLAG